MHFKYWNIYKTFIIDICTSSSFPLFVLYLVATSFCYKWKKIAGPIEFPKFLFLYNIVISLVNVICFIGFAISLHNSESLFSKKPDQFLRNVYWLYWITKIVELSDTLFMVLRHRFRQVSPLHVYHHATMLLLSEIGYKKYYWAAFAMPLMLNALVRNLKCGSLIIFGSLGFYVKSILGILEVQKIAIFTHLEALKFEFMNFCTF